MRFVAIFEDDVDPARLDDDLNRRHFDYLAERRDAIVLCGGLREEPAGPFVGTLWVIEAPDRAAARALVEADPYTRAGLRPRYRVLVWGKAPHLGAVTL